MLFAAGFAAACLAGCEQTNELGAKVAGIFGPGPSAPASAPPTALPPAETAPVPAPAPPSASTATDAAAAAAAAQSAARKGPPRVALLLPLTGPNAGVGRALLDAATQAVFEVADDDFVLLVRDTGGTPQGAAAAMDWAVEQQARLVVGPLLGSETQAVSARARSAGIVVLSFSNDRTVAAPGIFTLGIAPQDAIARTIEYARSRGLERFAALVPANTLGQAAERALRSSLASTGGELVRVERYDTGALDYAPAVRRLGQLAGPPPRLARGELGPPPPELDFEAVLVPDFGDRLAQVVAQLHGNEIDPARVKYLGIPLWNDPRTLREPSLQGAWFADTAAAPRAAFDGRFRATFGRPAPRVADLAYDAVALAAIVAHGKGPDGADFSLAALAADSGFAGVDGIFRLLPDGFVERGYAVLEVRRDGAYVLSPAPETFEAQSN
ncbi:MAG: ABC transporter substrate-binding protein [Alphaproteobacteria bacterium]|nr:ABC transporter substrate-binding protein [Alphaproteobacteria bacterium]